MATGSNRDPRWPAVIDGSERGILCAFVTANLAFPLVLFLVGWPRPWDIFQGEASPINWFSSVQCAMLGALGLAVFLVTRLGRAAGSDPIPRAWPWLFVSLGFFFLSFDEKFEIHENTRELFLKPHGWFTEIPGFKSSDVVLPLYAVLGVVLTYFLVRDLARQRRSLIVFLTAMGLIFVTAFQDSLQLAIFRIPWVRHTQIVLEEAGEVWAQALFAVALVWMFFDKLKAFVATISENGDRPAAPAP